MADKGQKTEKATPKHLEKARREGNLPSAREMVSALQFLAFAAMLAGWGGGWVAVAVSAALAKDAPATAVNSAAAESVAVNKWRIDFMFLTPCGEFHSALS